MAKKAKAVPEPEPQFPMDDDKWMEFFDLVQDIVADKGTRQEKRDTLYNKAVEHGAAVQFEEILNWFKESESK